MKKESGYQPGLSICLALLWPCWLAANPFNQADFYEEYRLLEAELSKKEERGSGPPAQAPQRPPQQSAPGGHLPENLLLPASAPDSARGTIEKLLRGENRPDGQEAARKAEPSTNSPALARTYKASKTEKNSKDAKTIENADGKKSKPASASGPFHASLRELFGDSFQPDELPASRKLSARHYPTSNENRLDLFFPYIENSGGTYGGVGTDQNFTLMARARSEWAYLIDFDLQVVYINRIHTLFFKEAANFKEFSNLWKKTESEKLVQAKLDRAHSKAFQRWRPAVLNRFKDLENSSRRFKWKGFHNDNEDYQHIRALALDNKIISLPGNLNGTASINAIAAHNRKNNQVMRIFYLSNAEDYFRSYGAAFKANLAALPYDPASVILRTCSTVKKMSKPEGEKFPNIPFHYNVQTFASFLAWLEKKPANIGAILLKASPIKQGLSLLAASPPVK